MQTRYDNLLIGGNSFRLVGALLKLVGLLIVFIIPIAAGIAAITEADGSSWVTKLDREAPFWPVLVALCGLVVGVLMYVRGIVQSAYGEALIALADIAVATGASAPSGAMTTWDGGRGLGTFAGRILTFAGAIVALLIWSVFAAGQVGKAVDAHAMSGNAPRSEARGVGTAAGAHRCHPNDVADCTEQCGKNDSASCSDLGVMYEKGRGVMKDEARAVTLYKQACDGGVALGCSNLGAMYAAGRGVTKDDARALALFKQACDGGEVERGCTNLGAMYASGQGVVKDESRALALFKQACDGGYALGCLKLGGAYYIGQGVTKDESRGVALFKQACDGGEAQGCDLLKTLGR